MTEDWQRKKYYKPRVLIDANRVLSSSFDDIWVCLTGAELEMLRNLTQYLHRHSTFVLDYASHYYITPGNEDWDTIQQIVANLEEKLMGCEDLLAELRAISNAIRGLTGPSSLTQHMVDYYITEGQLQYVDDYGASTVETDIKKCATAQLVWLFAYEVITEIFQPLQNKASDVMVPIAMVAIASWVGSPAIGIPVGLILATCWALAEAWEESQLVNVVNGFLSARHELVCAVYNGLLVDAQTAYRSAADIIEDLPAWSPIDIALGKLLYSPWVIDRMSLAWENATAWATNGVEAGYCVDCPPGITGSNWIAYYIPIPGGDVEIDHSAPGTYWEYGHVCQYLPARKMCGAVLALVEETGDCDGGPTGQEAGCGGERFTQDASAQMDIDDVIYSYIPFTHDEDEAIAALWPTAEKRNELVAVEGEGEWMASFSLGWNCEGTRTYRVIYVVYEYEP